MSTFSSHSHQRLCVQLLPEALQCPSQPLWCLCRQPLLHRVGAQRFLPQVLTAEQQQHFDLQPQQHGCVLYLGVLPETASRCIFIEGTWPRNYQCLFTLGQFREQSFQLPVRAQALGLCRCVSRHWPAHPNPEELPKLQTSRNGWLLCTRAKWAG